MAQSVRISAKPDTRAAVAGLREARRAAGPHIRTGLKRVAEEKAAPRVRRLAPGSIAQTVKGGATTRSAFVESKDPRVGLLNFGGTRRDVIKPKADGGAVRTPWGPRARVTKPRVYKGQHFMERGVEESLHEALPLLEDAVFDGFREAGFEVS